YLDLRALHSFPTRRSSDLCRRIEDLALVNYGSVARVRAEGIAEVYQTRKVTRPLIDGGYGGCAGGTLGLPVLLPGKEEEGFVATIVESGNPYGATQRTAVIVLLA